MHTNKQAQLHLNLSRSWKIYVKALHRQRVNKQEAFSFRVLVCAKVANKCTLEPLLLGLFAMQFLILLRLFIMQM